MSKAVASEVISLPTGGGAISGIGETFAPDPHTGTGNLSVPIALPSGRGGFQPELNLVYSTGNGNGPFGLGWSLSVPGVSRKTAQGIPRYDDARDAFVLSGAEDLVPVETRETDTRYRPRTEGLFARIIHHHAAGQNDWEVRGRDGLVSFYGTPESVDDQPAVVANPIDRNRIFAWRLTRTVDTFGNRIGYDYERDAGQDGSRHWDQLYLKRIRYVDHRQGSAGAVNFLVSVTFDYGDPTVTRPDAFSTYRSGFEIRTRRRCRRIVIATHAGEKRVARTYELRYLDERVSDGELSAASLPANGVSLLSQVKVVGHDGDRAEALPPLEFGYTRFAPGARAFFPLTGRELPAQSLAAPDLDLVDLSGNGLPDVVQLNDTARSWRNLGGGAFDLPHAMRDAPAGLSLADRGVQLLDADGDGRPDLVTTVSGLAGYFPLRFDGGWDRRSFHPYRVAPSFGLEDAEVRLVDLDGDGVTDAVRAGSRFECFFNDPAEGWNRTRRVERRDIATFPNVSFADPRVKWADLSGDGPGDIALVYDGNVVYWPNLGHGDWGGRVSMRNSPRFPRGYDPRRILVGDVDGDGLADLVYVDHRAVTLWINQSGNGWSEPIVIDGTPPVTDPDAVRLADMLGSGIQGVLWSAAANGQSRDHWFFLDFTGGVKPYLLDEQNNHTGAVTKVEYRPSTRFYLEDESNPDTRWQTYLPFPVQVISRVEVIDGISRGKLTTEYRYHHGHWDGAEREFRGFGMVEQLDTETFERYNAPGLHGDGVLFAPVDDAAHFSPPTLTKTWFHQGPIGPGYGPWEEADHGHEYWPGDPPVFERPAAPRDASRALRGRILRVERYVLDGSDRDKRPDFVTEHLHGVREIDPPDPGDESRRRIFFPHALARRTTRWERGNEPMTRFAYTGDYDQYGQPGRQVQIACPRGWTTVDGSASKDYLATSSETTFAWRDDEQTYIVDRVATTTSYEIGVEAAVTVDQLAAAIVDGSATRRVIGQTLNFYDGDAFTGLPSEVIGEHGALARTETLVLDEAILQQAHGDDAPPYLTPDGSPVWTTDYPSEFRDSLPIDGPTDPTRPGLTIMPTGHGFAAGAPDSPFAPGYFVAVERRRYDFHDDPEGGGRGLVEIGRDPLGRDTAIDYDEFDLLPTRVTDPAGLTTQARYDYRVLRPREVTDPNGNCQTFGYTPLGLPAYRAVMGKDGKGDTEDEPRVRFEYTFNPVNRGQPISVRTIRRVHHASDLDVPSEERRQTIETVEFSDGFGRLLQTRTRAEDVGFGDSSFGEGVGLPADQSLPVGDAVGRNVAADAPPRVVVSGWQNYDNKGRVVEKYEPFFATGWEYAPPEAEQLGQKATLFYDPRGQVIRTVNPDGSERRVIPGIPLDLADPERFAPTPWEAYTYDENDNAGRTPAADPGASQYEHHWNTPASVVVDALGRAIESVERNRARPEPSGAPGPIEEHRTTSTYDIRGNPLTVADALGRLAFRYTYDLADQALRSESIDAGARRSVLDATGHGIERRDGKGALTLRAYDALDRPVQLWARDAAGEPVTLRERVVYGDSPEAGVTEAAARAANLLGKPFKHFDEAGSLTFETYDFKGNLLEKVRRVMSDEEILGVFPTPNDPSPDWQIDAFRVDWQPPDGTTLESHAEALLDPTAYRTTSTYDALDRLKTMRYPRDLDGARQELRPTYNRAGALERVVLDGEAYVERIACNARGQRTVIALGNGVMTRYVYDRRTFRLARLRGERYTRPDALTYRPTGKPLQDFAYAYDLAGNVAAIADRTPGGGLLARPDQLDRAFSYDPLYRLISATGRECDRPTERPPWDGQPRCDDLTRTRGYGEQYRYDPVGNLTELRHQNAGAGFVRRFALAPGNNRLGTLTIGQTTHRYAYDPVGNLVEEDAARHFSWDHADRLKAFRAQVDIEEPSVYAHYLYDASGQRVKKLARKQGGRVEVTIYVDGVFEHHRIIQGATTRENDTLHLMDDGARVALVRVGDPFPDDDTPGVTYHLADHLGSSNVIVSATGALISREEYLPYGETSFGSFAKKRYRFTGKERDEESGLYYHGARYYAPWLARWVSCDPAGSVDSVSLYVYAIDNPLRMVDPSGRQSHETPEWIVTSKDVCQVSHHQTELTPPNGFPSEQLSGILGEWDEPSRDDLIEFITALGSPSGTAGSGGPGAGQPGNQPTAFENISREYGPKSEEYRSAVASREEYLSDRWQRFKPIYDQLKNLTYEYGEPRLVKGKWTLGAPRKGPIPDKIGDKILDKAKGGLTGLLGEELGAAAGAAVGVLQIGIDREKEKIAGGVGPKYDRARARIKLRLIVEKYAPAIRRTYYPLMRDIDAVEIGLLSNYREYEQVLVRYQNYQELDRRLAPGYRRPPSSMGPAR